MKIERAPFSQQAGNFIVVKDVAASMAFSPDLRILASGTYDGTVRLQRVAGGSLLCEVRYREDTHAVTSLAFSPDGQRLACGSKDGSLRLYSVARGRSDACCSLLLVLYGHSDAITGLAFSHDGRFLFSGAKDGLINLWQVEGFFTNVEKSRLSKMIEGYRPILGLVLSPNEQALAIVVDDEQINAYLWQFKGNTISSISEGLSGGEFAGGLAFSPDGQMLAVGLEFGLILWPVAEGLRSYNIEGLGQRLVTHVSFSPDGRFLASGSKNGTVMLYDMKSGRTWCILNEDAPVRSLAFSSDGETLAVVVEEPPRVAR